MALRHNSTLADDEPAWSEVDKTALPRIAFADEGEPDQKSTWRYPHHWVQGGTEKDDNGVWTDGTMYLHRGGLAAAWAAAQGARSGEEASAAVKAHLQAHREAIGLDASASQAIELRCEADMPRPSKSSQTPRIRLIAYTGEPIEQRWSDVPIVVDTAGIKARRTKVPVYLHHDARTPIGHVQITSRDGGELICEGRLSGKPEIVTEIVETYARGFPWAVSIGATIRSSREVGRGESVECNGRQYTGPLLLAESVELSHVAVVPEPADANTELVIHAERPRDDISQEKGQEMDQQKTVQADVPVIDPTVVGLSIAQAQAQCEAMFAKAECPPDDLARIKTAYYERLVALRASALAEKWLPERLTLELERAAMTAEREIIRASRPKPLVIGTSTKDVPTADVIEAALAKAMRLPGRETHYKAEVLERSDRLGEFGLHRLLLETAMANGMSPTYRISQSNLRDVLTYAFRPQMQAAWSAASISGILSNVANKAIVAGFNAVEAAWREISQVRPVQDFKTTTIYRLVDDAAYAEVPPGGEITHGTLSEESYTVTPKTYARMFALTMQDIVNDDLGALNDLQTRLGRNAALALNRVFWTAFLDNSSFFTSGRGNLSTSSPLGLTGLAKAVEAFAEMRDAAGNPTGIDPKIVLVPPALLATAKQLYTSTELRGGTTEGPSANPWAQMFRPLMSRYIGATIGGANGSDTTWYLVADPADLPVMVVAFVGGAETPTVESSDADFDRLGIQFRGYHSFGVAKAEYRAAVKATA